MISEWVVLQMLSWSHRQKLLLEWMRERKWGGHGELGQRTDWVGKRLGVLGYGSIGRQVLWSFFVDTDVLLAYIFCHSPSFESEI